MPGSEGSDTCETCEMIVAPWQADAHVDLFETGVDASAFGLTDHSGRQVAAEDVMISQKHECLADQPGPAAGIEDRTRAAAQIPGQKPGGEERKAKALGEIVRIIVR